MHEILRHLPTGARVLDLGCAGGSFPQEATRANVVRVDRAAPGPGAAGRRFVQADAAKLPFGDRTFAAVIANHSLEHFGDLAGALSEIGRVTCPGGALYVAVPDASTLTDKLYRWLGKGGGHVNPFQSASELAAAIEQATGLRHVATRFLCSSLSFMNRRNAPRPLPRRLWLLGAGYEEPLFFYAWLSRRLDRQFHTRTSIYGWALYFGAIHEPVDLRMWVNVCIRCGSGCAAATLTGRKLVRTGLLGLRTFRCPDCGARNPFAEDLLTAP
jgi:SAM-dependent methyltransferase